MLTDLARLYDRDLQRLAQEIDAYPNEEALWQVAPGITNSAGNLCLHLVGNLNEYIGRILGHIPYQRDRPYEFSATGLPKINLLEVVTATRKTVVGVLAALDETTLANAYPQDTMGYPMTVRYFLIHLHGHLNYHLGQIDYHRRLLTGTSAIPFV